MKILLACSAGTSTSLVVDSIKKYWKENDIKGNTIDAYGVPEAAGLAKKYDVVLLGPQVRFQLSVAKGWVEGTNIPVDVMAPQHYALAKAEEIWKQIQELTKK